MKKGVTQRKKTSTEDSATIRSVRLLLAAYIVVLLLAQLFTFEKFPDTLAILDISNGWAVLLVTLELLALPFLLDITLPKNLRRVSIGMGVAALVLLTALEIMAYEHGVSMLFGATFDLPGGSWSLLLISALWVLFVWSVWESVMNVWAKSALSRVQRRNKKSTAAKSVKSRKNPTK